MKKILVSLIAIAVALVGFAAADDVNGDGIDDDEQCLDQTLTEYLTYSFTKILESTEYAEMTDVYSYAGWENPIPSDKDLPGSDQEGYTIGSVVLGFQTTDYDAETTCCDDPYTQTLVQSATAGLILDHDEEKCGDTDSMYAFVSKAQDFTIEGQMEEISTAFTDEAIVGENYYDGFRGEISTCGNLWLDEESSAEASVTVDGDSWFELAGTGTESSTTLSYTTDSECPPILSGYTSAYAAFEEGFAVDEDDKFETLASSTATHGWHITQDPVDLPDLGL
jgi:hypothetical protein